MANNHRRPAACCPYSDDRDRKAFIRELKQFHENRGTAFRSVPIINGRPVDLHLLYTEVTALGGWMKVNDGHKWENIIRVLRLPKKCGNAALAIKQVYLRFLDHYEKIHFHGEDPDDDPMECSDSRGRRSQGNTLQVPMTYNFHQHEVSDAARAHVGMSMDLQTPCEYNKLAMSLHSSLPNEVDVAIKACMHMSCEGRRVLQLDKLPRLLDLLVAQTGIWSEGWETLRDVCQQNWRNVNGQDMGRFWERTVGDAEVKEILAMPGRRDLSEEDDLFNVSDLASFSSIEGQRILQVSIILRNLSFEECNVPVIASSPTSLKFLLLCAHCKWSNVRQTSLDTLGNIAPEIVLDPIDDSIAQLILRTITKNLLSNDRFLVIRGLEILAGVCQLEANRRTLSKSLEARVYEQICLLLTVHDIMLLIYALDCLYRLSELGKRSCSAIAGIHRMIDTLVNLLTLESQSYGHNACVRMKLIETCGIGTLQPSHSVLKPHGGHYTAHSGRLSTIQLLPGYQELDNETFATNWLKAYYEIGQGRSVSQTELYSDYQSNCIKLGKKGLVGPTQLSNYTRAVFPHVLPRRADGGSEIHWEGIRRRATPLPVTIFGPLKVNSIVTTAGHGQHVSHVRVARTQSSSPGRPSSPIASGTVTVTNHSPILKAQLSAPPRNPTAGSHGQRQLAPGTGPSKCGVKGSPSRDSSTLIKSLLASKVSQNMQQRQQLLQQQLSTCGSGVTTTPPTSLALGSQIAVTAVAPCSSPAGANTATGTNVNFTTPRSRPGGQLSAMLGHTTTVGGKTRLNGVQRALQMPSSLKVNSNTNNNHEDSSNSSGSLASSLDGDTRPPRPSSSSGDLVMSLREALNDKGKLRNGNLMDTEQVAQPTQGTVKHKGVLADLLEGKVHTDALLLMNGIVDKRKQQLQPQLTNGDAAGHAVRAGTATVTAAQRTTTTVIFRSGSSDDLIGFPRVSIDQLNQIRQQENSKATVGVKRATVIATAVSEPKRARMEKQTVAVARVVAVAKNLPETQSIKPSPSGPGPGIQVADAEQKTTTTTTAAKEEDAKLEYVCEWKDCKKSFERAAQVFVHACRTHVRELSPDLPCQWENCDQMIRQKYSLMTHLQDRHCGEQMLQLQALRRRDLAKCGTSSIALPPPPPPHPGYAPNAAVQAIRRHALEFVNPKELAEEREGPVTKSVRLTAALIIRNLVLNSSTGRRLVRRYEDHLATIAVGNAESSRTIAQCLWELDRICEPQGCPGQPSLVGGEDVRTPSDPCGGTVRTEESVGAKPPRQWV